MRMIFVPQYPTPNRYPSWWFWKFPEEFRKAGFEVKVLGEQYAKTMVLDRGDHSNFSPIRKAINFELEQIHEYCSMELRSDDILFLADLSFPGLFCNALYHQRPKKMFAFCHATSANKYDIFEDVRYSKFPVETAHADLFNKIFVGSEYHAGKILWPNTVVTSLPSPTHLKQFKNETKIYQISSASRPGKQKVDSELEAKVEDKFGKIMRKETTNSERYYEFLGRSKVLLITSHEDTFGYQIVDAINNNCIPIARNGLSYPELLAREYLYDNEDELMGLLDRAIWGLLLLPRLKCKEKMNDFYNKIIQEMKE
jgi:hypothetical protein